MTKDGNLRAIFRHALPHVHWQSIETALTGSGVPDANGCARGREFWVEFKITHGWAIDLAPFQVAWLARRTRAGGRTFVAVRRLVLAGVRRQEADELWLIEGRYGGTLRRAGLRGTPVLDIWDGGPTKWVWPSVSRHLLGW